LLRKWAAEALQWARLPEAALRAPEMQLLGKELVNAACVRRCRDRWKQHCGAFQRTLESCVAFAEEHLARLWRDDLSHRVLLQLTRAAPERLAAPLAAALPMAALVPQADRDYYERAVVALLRAGRTPCLFASFQPERSGDWERRLGAHVVRLGGEGDGVLLAWLRVPQERFALLARRAPLRDLLHTERTRAATRGLQRALARRVMQLPDAPAEVRASAASALAAPAAAPAAVPSFRMSPADGPVPAEESGPLQLRAQLLLLGVA
jgi:hypothetical protein